MTNGEFWDAVERRVFELLRPEGILCPRCGCTVDSFDDRCFYVDTTFASDLNCAGWLRINRAYEQAEREIPEP